MVQIFVMNWLIHVVVLVRVRMIERLVNIMFMQGNLLSIMLVIIVMTKLLMSSVIHGMVNILVSFYIVTKRRTLVNSFTILLC